MPGADKIQFDNRIHFFVSEAAEVNYVDVVGKSKFRSWLIRTIHSSNAQFTLGFLLLLDVAVLFTEVFLDASFPPCYAIRDNAVCEIPGANESVVVTEVEPSCLDRPELVTSIGSGLYYASLTILSIFEVEIFLLLVALRIQFLRNLGYSLDTFIVTLSIILEVMLHNVDNAQAAAIIIFARAWRLIRISHGLFSSKRRQLVAGMVLRDKLPEKDLWEEGFEEELEGIVSSSDERDPGEDSEEEDDKGNRVSHRKSTSAEAKRRSSKA